MKIKKDNGDFKKEVYLEGITKQARIDRLSKGSAVMAPHREQC